MNQQQFPWPMRMLGMVGFYYIVMEKLGLGFWWTLALLSCLDCMYGLTKE